MTVRVLAFLLRRETENSCSPVAELIEIPPSRANTDLFIETMLVHNIISGQQLYWYDLDTTSVPERTNLLFFTAGFARACLETSGEGHAGLGESVSVTTVDNGMQTCNGMDNSDSDTRGISRISGYALSYDWGEILGPLTVTYSNPANTYSYVVPLTNWTEYDCCGDDIPCSC
ncbi:hypothetical protein B0H10DRAFT_2224812 [Mycena sp. CBHHK59/15]|nr:hypothetical protein B0H10DRAFT_2224812 [Mycena sp. CBHHK59/15]